MRVFAISDLHADYQVNRDWIDALSRHDYRDDVLILAGDVADRIGTLGRCLEALAIRFRHVLFVPGNHDLWVDDDDGDSLAKFAQVARQATDSGASMAPLHLGGLSIVPLLSWYDYSFGEPCARLKAAWRDFRSCRWPEGWQAPDISRHFLDLNEAALTIRNDKVITFSHFLPRPDVMPHGMPPQRKLVFPVLGATALDAQIRRIMPHMHVYGHSHINRHVHIAGITYVNNAFGYPKETHIAAKQLVCIDEL